MRIWGKIWKNNHLLRDTTIEDFSDNTRTHKVFHALDEICLEFDLAGFQYQRISEAQFYQVSSG